MGPDAARPTSKPLRLTIASDPLAVRDGLCELLQSPQLNWITTASRSTTEIVLAEVLNNIVEHAYAEQTGTIDVCIGTTEAQLLVEITDHGNAMPYGALPDGHLPDPCSPANLPEGGFGWHLIRTLVSGLTYFRADGENHLSFRLPVETRVNCTEK